MHRSKPTVQVCTVKSEKNWLLVTNMSLKVSLSANSLPSNKNLHISNISEQDSWSASIQLHNGSVPEISSYWQEVLSWWAGDEAHGTDIPVSPTKCQKARGQMYSNTLHSSKYYNAEKQISPFYHVSNVTVFCPIYTSMSKLMKLFHDWISWVVVGLSNDNVIYLSQSTKRMLNQIVL